MITKDREINKIYAKKKVRLVISALVLVFFTTILVIFATHQYS